MAKDRRRERLRREPERRARRQRAIDAAVGRWPPATRSGSAAAPTSTPPSRRAERGNPADPSDDRYAGITIDDSERHVAAPAATAGGTVIKLDPDFGFGVSGLLRLNPAKALEGVTVRDLALDGSDVDARVVGRLRRRRQDRLRLPQQRRDRAGPRRGHRRQRLRHQERTKELVIKDSVAEHTGFGYAGSGAEAFSGFVADFARDAVLVNNQARDGGAFGFNIVTNPNDLALLGNLVAGNAQGGVIVQGGSGGANVGVPAEDKATHDILVFANDLAAQGSTALRIGNTGPRCGSPADVVAGDNGVPASACGSARTRATWRSAPSTTPAASATSRPRSARPAPTRSRHLLARPAPRDSAATTRSRARTAPTSWPAARAATRPVRVRQRRGARRRRRRPGPRRGRQRHRRRRQRNDTVDGGSGNDLVVGGIGADTVSGQAGNDDLIGGSGIDLLSGAPATSRLRGGPAPTA
jgi:hypothetical protein